MKKYKKLVQNAGTGRNDTAEGIALRGKTYWLRWTPESGQGQRSVSLKTRDYAEALQTATRYRENPTLAGIGAWDYEVKLWLAEAIDLETHTKATAISTLDLLKMFFSFVGKDPNEVEKKDAEQFFDAVLSGYFHRQGKKGTDSTVKTYNARISSFFNFLIKKKKLRANPLNGIVLKKPKKESLSRTDWKTTKEIKILLSKCKRKDIKFVLLAGFTAGMRKAEIINAAPSWFDLETHSIHIPSEQELDGHKFQAKSKRSRDIPLSPPFHRFLTKSFKFKREQVFCLHDEIRNPEGRYRWDFRRPYDEHLKFCNIKLNVHGMRHSFATNCLRADVSMAKVANWLGDRVRTVENHYSHLLHRKGELSSVFK